MFTGAAGATGRERTVGRDARQGGRPTGRQGTRQRIWARIVDDLDLRGNEWALHVGARRGAVADLLARRLQGGRVTGIVPEPNHVTSAPRGVIGGTITALGTRVELVKADPRFLPIEYGSVDAVVAGLDRLHLPREVDRRQVLRELVRVVRHGRSLAVIVGVKDLEHTESVLHETGTSDIRVWKPQRAVFPAVRVVTATRPPRDH